MHLRLVQKKRSSFLEFQSCQSSFFSEAIKDLGAFDGISKAFSATLNMRGLFLKGRWGSETITQFQNLRPMSTSVFTAKQQEMLILNSLLLLAKISVLNAYKHLDLAACSKKDSVAVFCQHCSCLAISLSNLLYHCHYHPLLSFI